MRHAVMRATVPCTSLVVACVLAAIGLVPASAHAQPTRVIVLDFGGPGGSRVRAMAVRALSEQDGLEVVSRRDARRAADRLHARLDDARGVSAVAAEVHAQALVDGRVRRSHGHFVATVRVRRGADGEVIGHAELSALRSRDLARTVRRELWSQIGAALQQTQTAGSAHASDDPQSADTRADVGASDAPSSPDGNATPRGEAGMPSTGHEAPMATGAGTSARAHPAFELGGGLAFVTRSLAYNDDLFGQLRAYAVPGAPALRLEAAFYPGAAATSGPLSWLGVTGQFQYAFALSSANSTGVRYPTSFMAWSLGARLRLPLGAHALGLDVAYGQESFRVDDVQSADPTANTTPGVPSVRYSYVEVGPDATLALGGRVRLRIHAGYRHLLSMGDLNASSWFPRATGAGLSGGIGFGYRITRAFEARIAFDAQRYFFAFNPKPGDPRVAGGAVDQYFSGSVALVFHLDGAGAADGARRTNTSTNGSASTRP